MKQRLILAGWPVEDVGPHESPNYRRVKYTGEPSVNEGTPCPPADTPHRCSVKAGMIVGARKDALRTVNVFESAEEEADYNASYPDPNGYI